MLIRPGALGDALLTFPAMALLRRAHPGARVTLVARGDVLSLAVASGLADAGAAYEDAAWAALFEEEPPRGGRVAEVVGGAVVVAWLGDADGTVRRALGGLGAREVVIAESRSGEGSRVHAALHLAQALESLGVVVPSTVGELAGAMPGLRVAEADEVAALAAWEALGVSRGARVVALHAGSGGAAKRWAPEAFAAVAAGLREVGYTPLLIEGPQDEAVTRAVVAAMSGEEALLIVRGLAVGALVSVLRRCAAYLGNDAGVTHLAALAGVLVVALFGPSDPALWSPLGTRVRVVQSPSGEMAGIGVEVVMAALREVVAGE